MITRKDKKIQFSEYAKHFSDQISNADNLRGESLQRLRKIRVSRQKNQQRQLNRLAEKFGDNDVRVNRQTDRIVREKEIVNYMDVAIDKNTIDTDSIKDSYILRGKIRGDKFDGLAGYTVHLADAKNNVVGKPVKTDRDGNYSFIVEIKEGEKPGKLNIVVLNKQGTQIHKDKVPISLKADVVDTRDIVIAKMDKVDRAKDKVIKNVLKTKKPVVRNTKTVKKKFVKKVTTRKPGSKKPK